MESKKTTSYLYLDDFHARAATNSSPKSIHVTVSLIGLKYPQILNWLYDITVVVRIVVVQTNLGRA